MNSLQDVARAAMMAAAREIDANGGRTPDGRSLGDYSADAVLAAVLAEQAKEPPQTPEPPLEVEQAVYHAYEAARTLQKAERMSMVEGQQLITVVMTGLHAARRFIFNISLDSQETQPAHVEVGAKAVTPLAPPQTPEPPASYKDRAAYRASFNVSAPLAPAVANRWEPIATAPESTHVLVWLPNVGVVRGLKTTVHGVTHWWSRDESINPTHWQPEPLAPAVEPHEFVYSAGGGCMVCGLDVHERERDKHPETDYAKGRHDALNELADWCAARR